MKNIFTRLIIRPFRKTSTIMFGGIAVMLCFTALLAGCRTHRPLMNERLFFNQRHVNIYHMDHGEDSLSMRGMLTEMVNYTNRDATDRLAEDEKRYSTEGGQLDTSAVYRLSEVRVTAAQSFTPERDGRLFIEFQVIVPQEVISTNWGVLLTPEMRYLDSIVPLKEIWIRGENFADFQREGYQKWNAYVNGIVGKDDYDNYFLDWDGINSDIRKRQEFYRDEYNKDVRKYMKYYRYRQLLEERYAWANTKKDIKKQNLYYRKHRDNRYKEVTRGVTTDVEKKYKNQVDFWPHYHLGRELTPDKLPRRYRQAFIDDWKLGDIKSRYVSVEDSLDIIANRYRIDQIVMNEHKDAYRDREFIKLVPYPYREALQLDTVVAEGRDFRFVYSFDYPFVPGMKSIDVSMTGKAEAIDLSTFDLPPTDTLNFAITSMDQLADTDLVNKRTRIYKNVFANLTVNIKYQPNGSNFDINYEDNRAQIDTMINSWRSYSDRGLRIDSVLMTASSSLDGAFDFNANLSRKRVNNLKEYLMANAPAEMEVARKFRADYIGEDWNTMVKLVQQNPNIKNKAEILRLLTTSKNPDATEWELRHRFKADYQTIRQEIYPKLRKVDVIYYMSYPGMVATDSVVVEYRPDYARALEMVNDRDYWGALDILSNYPDYNLALVLANLGFNNRAYDLLVQLEQTANVHYLTAIVCARLDMKEEAMKHLIKACEMDRTKISRASRDPEIRNLLIENNMLGRLSSLVNSD